MRAHDQHAEPRTLLFNARALRDHPNGIEVASAGRPRQLLGRASQTALEQGVTADGQKPPANKPLSTRGPHLRRGGTQLARPGIWSTKISRLGVWGPVDLPRFRLFERRASILGSAQRC